MANLAYKYALNYVKRGPNYVCINHFYLRALIEKTPYITTERETWSDHTWPVRDGSDKIASTITC